MKKIAILGLTGSIGRSAADVILSHRQEFQVVLASSHNNYQELFRLSHELAIPNLLLTNTELKSRITDTPENIRLYWGDSELSQLLAELNPDIVLNAISGSAGLYSSMVTLSLGIDLALANKESLVMAGHLINRELQRSAARLIPVDSEHSAVLQAIGSTPLSQVRKIILTASGGPFLQLPPEEFSSITVERTMQHPTWSMGPKITVDSATMLNKALEVIEAHWLFHKDFTDIQAVVHPQSIIHSLVEFCDGSLLAQLGFPNMKLPILYALSYPDHLISDLSSTNILDLPWLSFLPLDEERYPLYYLAVAASAAGGLMPTIMNAANEAAVTLFLERKISFPAIHRIVADTLNSQNNFPDPDLETILAANLETYSRIINDN